ncbi:MAG: hypothetical protein SFT81_00975 [Candidatus Caenarcaniphilales bacterium]|nr:hypothetical protein [Candidatus Caenarcaniphilales bacterium]
MTDNTVEEICLETIADLKADEADRGFWRGQYNMHLDMYKFYMSLVIQINGFFFTLCVGVLTVFFSFLKINTAISWVLLVPILCGVLLIIFFVMGDKAYAVSVDDFAKVFEAMSRNIDTNHVFAIHDIRFLNFLLKISYSSICITVFLLIALMVYSILLFR